MDYKKVRAWRSAEVRHTYTAKDTMLYALGLGIGKEPLDPAQLRFVYEKDLLAIPSFASVLASPGFWMREREDLKINFYKLVHGEQHVRMHAPLPASGTLASVSNVSRIVDKGADKGALMHVEKHLTDAATGQAIATVESVLFLRGDGGFTNAEDTGDAPAPAMPSVPEGAPDLLLDLPTRPEAALIYRLSGDVNPLHADPEFAKKAGFPKPILHGLATYGMVCYGIIKSFCDNDPARLKSIGARFSSPVFPGETIRLEAWRKGSELLFRARVVERDVVVISHGTAGI
ncbi:MAG: MaoC/PaaZ C-terminal domain-containing protein [Janthinobacterium lividum]